MEKTDFMWGNMKKKFFSFIFAMGVLLSLNVLADEKNLSQKLDAFYKRFGECQSLFDVEKQKCSESGSFNCYDHLTALHHDVQKCYVDIGIDLFTKFYNLKDKTAREKLNKFITFAYDNYLFIYAETNFCNENKCGISPYLYSEYATTEWLKDYIGRMLSSITARQ